MSTSETRATVERYLRDAVNGADPTAARRLVADVTVWDELAAFTRAFPDARTKTNLLLVQDELVAVNLSGNGTHEGMFQGIPPTGRRWVASCSAFFRVDDGRISDSWVSWDLLAILEQLGAIRRSGNASA